MQNRNRHIVAILLCLCLSMPLHAQRVKDFFYADTAQKQLPILLRGDLTQGIILIYVQGGYGETAIDFGRADYPRWKRSLEQSLAIAYYDQRGLNQKQSAIDSSQITYAAYARDLITIATQLKEKYQAQIYLLGHSMGGHIILHTLRASTLPKGLIRAAILANTSLTTDFSPERYQHYRPLYLKNLAKEMIDQGHEVAQWQEALNWMVETDTIHDTKTSQQWNAYVDMAYQGRKRRIGPIKAIGTVLSRPYGLFRYFYRKDNAFVGDLLWRAEEECNYALMVKESKTPMLWLTGRYDDIAPPEEIEAAVTLQPLASACMIANAAHESFLDQPVAFANCIIEFISAQ